MAHLVVSALQHVEFWRDSFPIWHKWSLAWECVACNDLWPWPVSSRSFSDDFAIKLLKYVSSSLARRGVNNPIFSICAAHERVCHMQWPLALTYIFKVMWLWRCLFYGLYSYVAQIQPLRAGTTCHVSYPGRIGHNARERPAAGERPLRTGRWGTHLKQHSIDIEITAKSL